MGNFIANLFVKALKSALMNDKELKKMVADADKNLEDTRAKIENDCGGDKELVKKAIPPEVRKYLGFDY